MLSPKNLVYKYHLVNLYYSSDFFFGCFYSVVGFDENSLHLHNSVFGFF